VAFDGDMDALRAMELHPAVVASSERRHAAAAVRLEYDPPPSICTGLKPTGPTLIWSHDQPDQPGPQRYGCMTDANLQCV